MSESFRFSQVYSSLFHVGSRPITMGGFEDNSPQVFLRSQILLCPKIFIKTRNKNKNLSSIKCSTQT